MAAYVTEQMITPRRVVLLSDKLPGTWQRELRARDLQVQTITDDIAAIRGSHADNPRAIIVRVEDVLTQPRQARLVVQCIEEFATSLDRGVLPVLVVSGTANDFAWASQLIDDRFPNVAVGIDDRFRPVVVHLPNGPAAISERCARHFAGRPHANVPLESEIPIFGPDQILLQRAFNDAERIIVETLQGRQTPQGPSNVYKVRTISPENSSPIYWVVKTLPYARSDSELGALRFSLPGNTPFANVPPLAEDRCVTTSCRSSIVMQFVDRAKVLSTFLETHSPAMAIASLFDGPLRCWRSKTLPDRLQVGKYALTQIASVTPSVYRRAYRKAKSINPTVRTPNKLLKAILGYPSIPTNICFSHGDLHLGNIFVREGSNDIVLIDFNRSGLAPASRDAAELDAALAFASGKDRNTSALPSEHLRLLYSKPVLRPLVLCRTDLPRAQAVEQVRRQVVGTCDEEEYRLMLACHCLWWAKQGNAEAYLASDRLV